MRTETKKAHIHRKRHGNHQKRTGKFLKVYSPYLPLIILVISSIVLSFYPFKSNIGSKTQGDISSQNVLAYATDMSVSGLLGSTNQQRANNSVSALSINTKLNSAAQAKANDMVTRDYWSHNTPDGNPPWVFITNAGYSYSRAGENLAYGYATSSDTITGWMRSPTHKANMLDSNYTEVGFGFANSVDFIGSPDDKADYPHVGNQTIIVAMYATPYIAPSPTAATKPSSTTTTPVAPAPSSVSSNKTTPSPQSEVPSSTENNDETTSSNKIANSTNDVKVAATTDATTLPKESSSINRLQLLTKNSLPWLGSMLIVLSLSGGLIVLGKHGFAFHNFVIKGERYVLQHTLFDVTIISLIVFTVIASKTVGFIL